MNEAAPVGKDEGGQDASPLQVDHATKEGREAMTAEPVHWTRSTTRRELLALATRVAWNERGAADTARSIVPLLAAECCRDALKVFFRLAAAIRDGRTGSADMALEELLGGEAA